MSALDGQSADDDLDDGATVVDVCRSAVTLEGGLALGRDLERWACARPREKPREAEVVVVVVGPGGEVENAFRLRNAHVSSYRTLPGLDSDIVDAIAIDCVTVEHEGWDLEAPPVTAASA
jgi:hypothetical protein